MNKLLLTNVVYGPIYADLFLNQHLKSFLDESNIPRYKDRIQYVLFTDAATRPTIEAHPNFIKLKLYVQVGVHEFVWPAGEFNRFNARYSILVQTFKESVQLALGMNCLLSALVADLVIAKDFFTKIFARLDAGHDSVFVLPLRSAAESIIPHLNKEPAAQTPMELFRLGYNNLHPLWVSCHWRSPQFTKLPFTLMWNSGTGLLARSYSITPIAFMPTVEMLEAKAVIDIEVPSMCKNPYWAHDWIDCPIIGVEPLFCYYPTFRNFPSDIGWVKEWAKCLHPAQKTYLAHKLYYPSKDFMCSDTIRDFGMHAESDTVTRELMT